MLNFANVAQRRGWNSKKWARFAPDVLPLPVADMDCTIAEPIQAAIEARVAHGVFGYDHPPANAMDVLRAHFAREYDWQVEAEWIVPVAGVVPAQFAANRAFSSGNGQVVTPTPVYHSFPKVPDISGDSAHGVDMVDTDDGRSLIDLDAFERALEHPQHAGVALLCNPHNPGGAVYRHAELQRIADACAAHRTVMVSDEIWADLILDPIAHVPMAKVSPDWGVSILAGTKTWNIAGLPLAFVVIPNPDLRAKFTHALMGYPDITNLAWHASIAAYQHGGPWRTELLDHLRAQRARLLDFVAARPALTMARMEGTYLAWLDCRALNRPNLHADCVAAGVGPDDGAAYGKPGYLRFNLACSAELLDQALVRLAGVIDEA